MPDVIAFNNSKHFEKDFVTKLGTFDETDSMEQLTVGELQTTVSFTMFPGTS